MQNIPDFPTNLTSATPSAVVRINGVQVNAKTVSVTSELAAAMPSHVGGAGGIVAATGDVQITPPGDVARGSRSPWAKGVPQQGDKVTVDMGYGAALARQFTGIIDGSSGSARSESLSASLVDAIDRLDVPVSIPARLNVWPALEDGNWTWRRAGLSTLSVTDRVLRACGFNATPPMSAGSVFYAPMMGTALPERGFLTSACAQTDASLSAAFWESPWGLILGNAEVTYTPWLGANSGRLDTTFQMTFMSRDHQNPSSSSLWTCWWGGSGIRVAITSSGTLVVQTVVGASTTTVLSMNAATRTGATAYTVRVTPAGAFSLYANNGATTLTGTAALPAGLTTTPMSSIEVKVPQTSHPMGGLQASFTTHATYAYVKNAHLTPPSYAYGVAAFPGIVNRPAIDILREQSEAELAAMWLDENGHFRWVNRDVLTGSAPSGTLTALDHLLDLEWEFPPRSVYSRVDLEASRPTINRRVWPSLLVWQGSGETVGASEEKVDFIEPPSDMDWFMVDEKPQRVASSASATVKLGRGSYFGGALVVGGTHSRWATSSEFQQSLDAVNHRIYKLTSTASPALGADVVDQVIYGTEYGRWHNESLAILRAKATAQWEKEVFTGSARGPVDAPVLQHDVGPWIYDSTEAQGYADWLAGQVTVATAILRDVPIVPDPRIQKGDIFWLEDDIKFKVRLKVVIMGLSLSVDSGPPVRMTQSITCRVLSVQHTYATLAQHDAVWADTTLSVHDAYWSGFTLGQQDAEPLRRG